MINPTASPLFDAITCTSNVATHNGGCIYIGETSASKTFSFDNPSGASTWNKNEANLGGVVYVDSNQAITISVTDSTMNTNIARTNGAVLYVKSSGAISATFTTSTIQSNKALTSGSILYVPNTAGCSSSLTLDQVTMQLNEAVSDGGAAF